MTDHEPNPPTFEATAREIADGLRRSIERASQAEPAAAERG